MGVIVPDINMMGNKPKKHNNKVCCKVLVMEAIITPIAIALIRKIAIKKINNGKLPLMGTPNHQIINRLGKKARMPTISVGMVLAKNISHTLVGVTIS